MIISGSVLLGFSWAIWGYLESVENRTVFIIIFVLCRIIQGLGISACQTSSYAILTILYPEEVGKAVATIEGSVGIGLAVGPGFGSLFYFLFGFKGPFYWLSIIYFFSVLFVKIFVSEEVETNPNNMFHVTNSAIIETENKSSPVTYKALWSNK